MEHGFSLSATFIGGGLLIMAGCTLNPYDSDPNNPAYGRALYDKSCASCHGTSGRGDGPAVQNLPSVPADLRQLALNNGGTYDKDRVMAAIYSSPSEGMGVMPAFLHGDLGPVIQVEENGLSTPIPTDLLAIANYLETIQDE